MKITYCKYIFGCLLLCFISCSFGYAQEQESPLPDRWHGLIIDQSTPEDVVRILGKPVNDKVDRLHIHTIDRWVSAKHKEKIFRTLSYGQIDEVKDAKLSFMDNKLVMINLNLGILGKRKWPAASLTDRFGVGFTAVDKLPKLARPQDYVTAKSVNRLRMEDNVYNMLGVSQNSFIWAYVTDQNFLRNFARQEELRETLSEMPPLPGKVMLMEMVSRRLEKQ